MSYATPEKLEELIGRAIASQDIQSGLLDANLTKEELTEVIKSRESEIWKLESDAINQFDRQENDHTTHLKRIKKNYRFLMIVLRPWYWIPYTLFAVWTTIAIIVYGSPALFIEDVFGYSLSAKLIGWILLGLFFSITIVIISAYFVKRRQDRQTEIEISGFKVSAGSMGSTIDLNIIEKVIKSRMRAYLNERIKPSYKLQLENVEIPGLAEVIDISRTIDTQAKQHLDFLLNNMPGGSIGIAGPRGVGKSTLIQMYCGAQRSVTEINKVPILPVMTSAPVKYEARDFLLHLFSQACHSYIRLKGEDPLIVERDPFYENQSLTGSLKRKAVFVFNKIKRYLLPIGFTLVIAGVGIFFWRESNRVKAIQSAREQAKNSTTILNQQSGNTLQYKSFNKALIKYFEKRVVHIEPFDLMIIGIFLMGIGIAVNPDERVLSIFIPYYPLVIKVVSRISKIRQPGQVVPEETIRVNAVISEARQWIRQIKFQQSFTAGWSGKMALPIAAEGSINRAMTVAERQLTGPEIVTAFTGFLNLVSQEYKIIIGIDEMDKLESDEFAQQFLNEIKSIFGVRRCFFLISVSENAMSSFEKRGIPFRDVFDSSLDGILYVDYFNLEASKRLLERRVVGRPIPYFYLSYCLSGGLPRDLIRNFRQVIRTSQVSKPPIVFDALVAKMVQDEVAAKSRAILISVNRASHLPEMKDFFSILYSFHDLDGQVLTMENKIAALHLWLEQLKKKDLTNNVNIAIYQKMMQLGEEAYTYFNLMLATWKVFNDINESKILKLERKGTFEELAKARQLLTVDLSLAQKIIQEIIDGVPNVSS